MTPPTAETTEDDGVDRARLVRLLLVLAVAVPLVVEGMTFAGLLDAKLLGGGSGGPATDTATATDTPDVDRLGVGDEVLAGTPQQERITDATVLAREDGWEFSLSVRVENTADTDYRLTLGSVRTTGGDTVSGGTSAVVPAGENRTVTGTWTLPEGERPDTVTVVGVPLNDTDDTASETVPVERLAVQIG